MVDLDVGPAGAVLLVLVFVLLGAEDVVIWVRAGEVPGLEFFVAAVMLVVVLWLAVRQARANPPPRHP